MPICSNGITDMFYVATWTEEAHEKCNNTYFFDIFLTFNYSRIFSTSVFTVTKKMLLSLLDCLETYGTKQRPDWAVINFGGGNLTSASNIVFS